jgi:hypothetical protein
MNTKSFVPLSLAPLALAAGLATPAAAEWRWTVTPYVWASDVGIDVRVDDRVLVDETIAIADLLEDVETIAQVRLEARRDGHALGGAFLDLFDVTLADEAQTIGMPSGAGTATFAPEMGMTFLDLGGVLDPRGDGQGLQWLYGVRLLNQRATIEAQVDFADGSVKTRTIEIDETLVDGLVGVRYTRALGRRFSVQAQADVSSGGTELTWSAGPTFGVALGRTHRTVATLGYRHLEVDFDSEQNFDATMTLSGVVAALRLNF